jgi:hypothetical protein
MAPRVPVHVGWSCRYVLRTVLYYTCTYNVQRTQYVLYFVSPAKARLTCHTNSAARLVRDRAKEAGEWARVMLRTLSEAFPGEFHVIEAQRAVHTPSLVRDVPRTVCIVLYNTCEGGWGAAPSFPPKES